MSADNLFLFQGPNKQQHHGPERNVTFPLHTYGRAVSFLISVVFARYRGHSPHQTVPLWTYLRHITNKHPLSFDRSKSTPGSATNIFITRPWKIPFWASIVMEILHSVHKIRMTNLAKSQRDIITVYHRLLENVHKEANPIGNSISSTTNTHHTNLIRRSFPIDVCNTVTFTRLSGLYAQSRNNDTISNLTDKELKWREKCGCGSACHVGNFVRALFTALRI